MAAGFVHLHNHTDFSMLDGAARLKELFKEVAAQGMTHSAVSSQKSQTGTCP